MGQFDAEQLEESTTSLVSSSTSAYSSFPVDVVVYVRVQVFTTVAFQPPHTCRMDIIRLKPASGGRTLRFGLFSALSDPLQLPAHVQGGVYAEASLFGPGLLF